MPNQIGRENRMLRNMITSALCLALAYVLPFLTGQIPTVGNMLCPMHIPVLLCGFFCGPIYGAAVGAAAPLLRFALFGMPPMPAGIAMMFELAAYGLAVGILHRLLPKKPWAIYFSLLSAMVVGRIVWAGARMVLFGMGKMPFGWEMFLSGAFFTAIPGIVLQIVLIPILVLVIQKAYPKLK